MKVRTTLKKTVEEIKMLLNIDSNAAMELTFKSWEVYGKEETRKEMQVQGLIK
jgi:hypothetical protein